MKKRPVSIKNLARLSLLALLLPLFAILGSSQSYASQLSQPSGVTASTVGQSTSLTVNFNNVANASSYTVRVFTGTNYATLAKTVTLYQKGSQITGLTPNTLYRVNVTAIGSSPYTDSRTSSNSLPQRTKTPLATPTAPVVEAVAGNSNSIRITFSPVTNADNYSIQIYTYPNLELVGSQISPFTSGSTVSGLNSNTDYVVKVTASQSSGSLYSPSTSDYSNVVRTNVEPQLPAITSDPQNARGNPGQGATFSVTASAADGGVLSYQWQVSNGSDSYSDVSGANQSTLELTNLSLSQNGFRYRVVVTNTLNGATRSTTSNFATLTVDISSVDTLSSLSITPGTISPAFQSLQNNYSISISSTVTSLIVNANPSSNSSTMTLNGSTLGPNESTVVLIDSNSQSQVITITVTAYDSTTKTYVINIKRVISTSSSTVITPQTTPTPTSSPIKSTNQILKTPSLSVVPRINLVNGLSVTSGSVGTTVVIYGTNFDSVLSVKLGGLNIKPGSSLITPTSITVTIPAGARSGAIVVKTTKGSVSTPRFTVL